jgi:hypothetical protein
MFVDGSLIKLDAHALACKYTKTTEQFINSQSTDIKVNFCL